MKKFIVPFAVMAALFVITGCSEKFKIAAPYKDITVVYGFLEISDTAHYIRIQKAFLDQEKNALLMAQEPDSSFYAHLNVRIDRFSFTDTVHRHDSIHLTRVNLDAEGYPKQPGQFFTAPNYAYKFTNTLDPNYLYRIVITNLVTGKTDSSTTPLIDDTNPTHFYVDVLDTGLKMLLDFHAITDNKYFEMTGQYVPPGGFTFRGRTTPAAIGQAVLRFNWYDSNAITHDLTYHSYDYNAGFITLNNSNIDFKLYNVQLYSAVSTGLGVAPANTFRLLDRSDIFIYLSTWDDLNYQQASLTQGTGITGTEIEPIYTNISGENTIGLYTARAMRSGRITITNETVDSLKKSTLLQQSKIVGTIYH
jgi:hypothetical protein